MSASIYTEKLVEPDNKMLTYDLAETKSYFYKIAEVIDSEFGGFTPEWKFYNQTRFLNSREASRCNKIDLFL
jgi:hypothetical protein